MPVEREIVCEWCGETHSYSEYNDCIDIPYDFEIISHIRVKCKSCGYYTWYHDISLISKFGE